MPADARPVARARTFGALLVFALLAFIAILPWWRNHDILRDLYDYGLFINVNARLAQGERPFADFTTPAQSAAFVLNYVSEKLGGGTYLGMTRGAAGLIIASLGLLSLALARRWSPWAALLIAAAIVCTSAAQHTIVFYNPLGILSLALVTWSFAAAPLLRRQDLGWHALAAIGLFLGGLNKINYHLLACAMAVGWIVFGAVRQRAGLRPVVLACLFVFAFGVILPVATEVLWTGAGFGLWYYNVVELPLQARGGRVSAVFSPKTYLTTLHDYYGALRIPQAGLFGLLLPLVPAIAAWRMSPLAGGLRIFVVLAAVFAALASTALLLTNNEIAYLALSATLVFGVSLWLGFDLPARGRWFVAGLLVPALLFGIAGWESAWLGQRSQFGHSGDPRSEYLRADSVGEDFAYARGLRLPRGTVHGLSGVVNWRQSLPEAEREKIFYGPGCEWLEHIWPMSKVRGLAVIASAFDSPRESQLFQSEVLSGDRYRYMLVPQAWDYWNLATQHVLGQRFLSRKIEPEFVVYTKLREDVLSARPLDFFPGLGSNIVSTSLFSRMPMRELSDGRRFVGVDRGTGELEIPATSTRAGAEAVIKRHPGANPAPVPVRFEVFAVEGSNRYSRWTADAILPEGQDELVLSTGEIDSMGLPLVLSVSVPDAAEGQLVAGWRAPQIYYTPDDTPEPPLLRAGLQSLTLMDRRLGEQFLPAALHDADIYSQNAVIENGRIRFFSGGEIWIRLNGLFDHIEISGECNDPAYQSWHTRLKVVHYVGGRFQIFHPLADPDAASTRIVMRSSQRDGWLGLLAGQDPGTAPFVVGIESAVRP